MIKCIKKDYNIDKHINFIFNGSKPIREFGKYNLIPNDELPSSLDYLKLSNLVFLFLMKLLWLLTDFRTIEEFCANFEDFFQYKF